MNSLLINKDLNKCWLAGTRIELSRRRMMEWKNNVDTFDVPQNCENVLIAVTTMDLHISAICRLVLGMVRIYQIQVENAIKQFVYRPASRKRVISTKSQSTYHPKRRRIDSDVFLSHRVPKRGRYTWSDQAFISDFNNIHEEMLEDNLLTYMASPDSQTTHNSLITLQEPIMSRQQSINDNANNFGPASYHELQEFLGLCDQRNFDECGTQITVEVHPTNTSLRRSNSSLTIPYEEMQAKRQRFWEKNINQTDITEILLADDHLLATNETNPTNFDVQLTASNSISDSLPELTPICRRRSNASLTIPDEAIRQRIWEKNINQTDINEILPADLPLATNETSLTNFGIQLTTPEPISDSLPELDAISQKHPTKRSRKKPFRDLVKELKMTENVANLDCQLRLRHRELINNIPKKLYNPLERSINYTYPAMTKNSANILRMVRPTMAGCLMNRYQRNLKFKKISQKLKKEKTINAMTLLNDFYNKDSIELENLSYEEVRSQSQQNANIALLEPLELSSQTLDARSGRTSMITNARTNILSTHESVREPSCSLSSTEISNEYISRTSAAETQFTISDNTSDRFVDELNMDVNVTHPNKQIEWGPTGLLKKLYHLWNANCVFVDMKTVCHGSSRKCAAIAFFSLMVLQSVKFQYVVLEKDIGSNTIKNIRRSDMLDVQFHKYLEK